MIGSCMTKQGCPFCRKVTNHNNGSCLSCKKSEKEAERELLLTKWRGMHSEDKLDYLFKKLILKL